MGAIRRFSNYSDSSAFKFTIDTRLIVSGATDGSEDPLSFIIPFRATLNDSIACIVRVSDGRPDISINSQAQANTLGKLTFATAGIYQITIIGRVPALIRTVDIKKLISIDQWGGPSINFFNGSEPFNGASNLVVNATNSLLMPADSSRFFLGIKGFSDNSPLTLLDTSMVTSGIGMIGGTQMSLKSMPNSFWKSIVNFNCYSSSNLDPSVQKIEIISDTLTQAYEPFSSSMFRGRIEFKTPNLQSIFRFIRGYNNPPALGGVDIRSLTSCSQLIHYNMSPANVASTLKEWHTGYDWSAIPTIENKCTISFANSGGTPSTYYAADTEVIAAINFLTSKGYTITGLNAI